MACSASSWTAARRHIGTFVNDLERKRREGRLIYGMHKSGEALLTCMVFSYNRNHVHFVDGRDGGYAVAARGLKAQLKSLTT